MKNEAINFTLIAPKKIPKNNIIKQVIEIIDILSSSRPPQPLRVAKQ